MGISSDRFFLSLLFVVASAVRLTGTEYVELGRPIRLLCNASSGGRHDQPYHIAWYFEDRPVDSDVTSGLFITTKFEMRSVHSTVVISRSGARHQGVYECRTSGGDTDSMAVHILNGKYSLSSQYFQ